MLFMLKKFTGAILSPLPFLLLLMGAGLVLLYFSRWQKTAKSLLSAGWLMLLLLGLQPVADGLLKPGEEHYPVWDGKPTAQYIVVLGGGYTWNPQWAPGDNLLNNSLARVVEGVRLWRANPGATMIFTGAAAANNPVSAARVGASVAQSLGVPPEDLVILDKPKDTQQEALEVAHYLGNKPFLLVTSASHLPRAMVFFQGQGLYPVPAPAGQLAISSPLNPWERAIPSAIWLQHSSQAIYETLGRFWQRLTYDATTSENSSVAG